MRKKLLPALIAAVLVLCLALPASAISVKNRGQSGSFTLYRMVDIANVKIAAAVLKAQKTPADDVDQLLAKVDRIVEVVFDYADSIGAEVECVYVEYVIDGHTVLIDPLRVVNVGTGGTN